MKVRDKFLAIILPIVLLGFIIMTVFGVNSVKSIVDLDTEHTMENTLATKDAEISGELEKIKNAAETLADALAADYENTTIDEVGRMMTNVVGRSSDTIYGMGIWFEPYTILEKDGETKGNPIKWVGPYYYKDNNEVVMTEEYANDEYNFIEQEYYLLAKTSSHEAAFTDPYYDPTSGVIMASCVAPMYSHDQFIGCVTVDIEITSLQNIVESAVLRNNGVLKLVDTNGVFLAGIDHDKIAKSLNIAEEENFSEYAGEILQNSSGNFVMTQDGTEWVTYYKELSAVKWTLLMQMDQSMLNRRLVLTRTALYITAAIILFIVATMIIVLINSMVKRIRKSLDVMNNLANGNYAIEVDQGIQNANEFNNMEFALRNMFDHTKDIVKSIKLNTQIINKSNESLASESKLLTAKFGEIKDGIAIIADAMISSSAATQQVTASADNITDNVEALFEQTSDVLTNTKEIHERATKIKDECKKSIEHAQSLSEDYGRRVNESVEKAAVVENIGSLAGAIDRVNNMSSKREFRVESVSSRSLYQGLLDAKYDLIISVKNENKNLPERFEEISFKKSEPKLIISSSHPAYSPDMDLSKLHDYPMYIYSSLFSINAKKQILSHCHRIGFEPEKIEEFDGVGSLEMALYTGNGYTLTFPEFVRNTLGRLKYIPLQVPDKEAGFAFVYSKEKKKVLEPFIKVLTTIANQ